MPPFDLVFCRDDPDGEIVFTFTSEIYHRVRDLFPEIEWTKQKNGWWVAGVYRDYAFKIAPVAVKAGLRVGFGEYRDGVLTFSPVEVIPLKQH